MYLMFIAAVLPAVLLGLFIWRKDPHPEPIRWVLRAFFIGVGICIPVAFLEVYISSLLFGDGSPTTLIGSTVNAFCVAALPEEGAKLLVLWLFLRRCPQFDEHFDGIVYAVFISLGFATIENIGYVFQSGEGWVTTAVMRALLSVPGHYAFAIMMGYYYALYHFVDRSKANAAKIFLVPFLAHGVYDSIAMSGAVNPIAGSICTVVLVYFCIKLQKEASRKIADLIKQNNENAGTNSLGQTAGTLD